jgi:predicted CXXCH cytochrome family protein
MTNMRKLFLQQASVAAMVLLFQGVLAAQQPAQQLTPQQPAVSAAAPATDQCVACHVDLDERLSAPAKAMQSDDVHRQHGVSCSGCHGGDPTKEGKKSAMDPAKGFVGVPSRQETPRFCGKCHSNGEYMRRYDPAGRTAQESEYSGSVHGKRLKQGDQKVAVCSSCHGSHGIKAVKNPGSPVYPLHVAETCGGCHANASYMQGYSIPTDQLTKWQSSVHAEAMFKKQDLSAPTCNDCHGNHGAAPANVTSVANVCGTCHVRQAGLFQKSPHAKPFQALDSGACVQCHSNHGIRHPSDAMLGVGKESVCTECHFEGTGAYKTAGTLSGRLGDLAARVGEADGILQQAANEGMEVSGAQFDLKEARNKLIDSRVLIHSFSPSEVDKSVAPGVEIAGRAHDTGLKALAEFQFRRKGLAVSLIVIAIAIAALYLKLRQIEQRQAAGN